MKLKLGPVPSLLLAVVFAIAGTGYTLLTIDSQRTLGSRGVTGTAEVVGIHHPGGRISTDSVDVRLPGHEDAIEVYRYRGDPKVGDELQVRYDPNDPTTMTQEGVGVWGPFEFLAVFIGGAGIVGAIIEIRRWPRRRRRGRAVQPTPGPSDIPSTGGLSSPWTVKGPRRRRRG